MFALTGSTGAAGNLIVNAKQLSVRDGSVIEVASFGPGKAGSLSVQAQDVEVSGTSKLAASGIDIGPGGSININTDRILVTTGAQVGVSTFGAGQGGDLTVNATDSVQLIGRSADGQAASGLFSQVNSGGSGNGGNVVINTSRLIVRDGARVSAGTRDATTTGQGGTLTVNTSSSVDVIGTGTDNKGVQVPSSLFVETQGTGDAGKLTLTTGQLRIQDGGAILAATRKSGNGGNVEINADTVMISGTDSRSGISSGIFTNTSGSGEGGNLTIDTNSFHIANGGVLDARTTANGNGGSTTINANTFEATQGGQVLTTASGAGQSGNITLNISDRVNLSGSDPNFLTRLQNFSSSNITNDGAASGLFANTTANSTGRGGDILITPRQLLVSDGALVAVDSRGSGNAGSIQIAADSLTLDNRALLSANTASGEGGNITLQVPKLLQLRHNSKLSAEAGGTSNGGNIALDANLIASLENSNITANAFQGRGGNIQINTQGLFQAPDSSITASSQFGVSGEVKISSPDVDSSKGLTLLPEKVTDVSTVVVQSCSAAANLARGRFVVTGRGGLPANPTEPLSDETVLTNLSTQSGQLTQPLSVAPQPKTINTQTQLVEAQGWLVNPKGQVVLIAEAPTVTPHNPWSSPLACH
ncbi:MAG: hypothetical protein NVSMB70_11160 [Chamaesiphon sp.]